VSHRANRLPSIAALTSAATHVESLTGVGFSGASLSRVHAGERSYVLKRLRPDADWICNRTGDRRGREAMLLDEPSLDAVWEVFDCPYVAYAIDPDEIGLLMHDLSSDLFPDNREPLAAAQEALLIGSLARLHARFWRRPPELEWLARPAQLCDFVAPSCVSNAHVFPPSLRDAIPRGWQSALSWLPPDIAQLLTMSGAEWQRRWAHLPQTLVHGDPKVANFAITIDRRVSAFDWALAGVGPCSIDLGWYLAVNVSRLAFSKELTIRDYRRHLEFALEQPLADTLWRELESAAVIYGARTLLWSKALAVEAGREGAQGEWDWWVGQLARLT
jgi:phosphotransferase family enzyme